MRFGETELLKHIHQEGPVPGVVNLSYSQLLEAFTKLKGTRPYKIRLGLSSFGFSIIKAENANKLLELAYDLLEGNPDPLCFCYQS